MNAFPDADRWRERTADTPLPELRRVRQTLDAAAESDVAGAVRREFSRPAIRAQLRPGLRVALAVGSRGLAELGTLVRTAIAEVQAAGCSVTIVPAMGSHGGGDADGQRRLLAEYGVSEEALGVPVDARTDVVEVGRLGNGMPVFASTVARDHDLVVPINRVKSHTSFHGPVESGLTKMLVIGLGKRAGAQAIHARGYRTFAANLEEARDLALAAYPFGFGLATVENAVGGVARVEAIAAAELVAREAELLAESKRRMARLPFRDLDVLIVERAGKNISGLGMDPNVTGRYATPGMLPEGDELRVTRLVLLSLTPESEGNAIGAGLADVVAQRVAEAFAPDPTYTNATTSTSLAAARLPIVMPDDATAVRLALRTAERPLDALRIAWIRDTSHLETFAASEAALAEALAPLAPLGDPERLEADADGALRSALSGTTVAGG